MKEPARWSPGKPELAADCRVFKAWRTPFTHPDGRTAVFSTIEAFDWVVAFAETTAGDMVLVEQYRFGVEDLSLELPAGCIDEGESALVAAERELLEETGYAGEATIVGQCFPNPALQGNRCTFVWVRNARRVADPQTDEHEELTVHLLPLKNFRRACTDGRIGHALAIAALVFRDAAAQETGESSRTPK